MYKYSNTFFTLFLFLVALLTRLLWLDVPINTDEALWIDRGALFFVALLNGELDETYLRHHPGVTNMWLIGGALSLRYLLHQMWPLGASLSQFVLESNHLGGASGLIEYLTALASDNAPVAAYVQARVLFAFVTATSMTGIYLLTRRLLGLQVALIMAALLWLEPFYLAYQRFVTTDGNQSNFMWLSLLSFLLYLRYSNDFAPAVVGVRRSSSWGWLLLSAVCYGLALLSKVAVLLSLPAIGLWMLWYSTRRKGKGTTEAISLGWRVRDLMLWGIGVAVTCWLLWPVLWVDVAGNVTSSGTLYRWYQDLSGEVAGHYQFFFGQTTDDPGALYYPVLLLWRLSPALLFGTLFGIAGLFFGTLRRYMPDRTVLLAILLNLLIILLGISSQASKLDRYIIPLIPGLTILAAAGWLAFFSWAQKWWFNPNTGSVLLSRKRAKLTPSAHTLREKIELIWGRHLSFTLALVFLLCLQLVIFLPLFPYTIAYFNPLLGGATAAQQVIMVGNGEFLDQAADWLQQHRSDSSPTVASWYDTVFDSYYTGPTTSVWPDEYGRWDWVNGRYVVLYVNQIQRNLPFVEEIDYFSKQEPLHVVQAHGINYAYIYDGPTLLPEEVKQIATPTNFDFGEHVHLLGYEITTEVPSADSALLTLYWEVKSTFPDDKYSVFVRLRSTDGYSYSENNQIPVDGFFPVNQWQPGQLIRDVKEVHIPPGTPPGEYHLQLSFYSYASQKGLEIRNEEGVYGDWITLTPIQVTPPVNPLALDLTTPSKEALQIAHPLTDSTAFSISMADADSSPPLEGKEAPELAPTRLLAYEWSEIELARAGDAIPLTLLWQVGEQASQINVRLQLRQGDKEWQRLYARPIGGKRSMELEAVGGESTAGEFFRDIWDAYLPADAPSGRYQLDLVAEFNPLLGEEGTKIKSGRPDVIHLNLGEIEIEAREHNFSAPQPDFPQIAELAQKVRLLGYQHKKEAVAGEEINIILYWQALGEIEHNYVRFVHLLNSEGERVAQRDSQPGEGSLPTTSWVTNEFLSENVPLYLPETLPPGEYHLMVGFYDPTNWQRLMSADGTDHILLTQPIRVIDE